MRTTSTLFLALFVTTILFGTGSAATYNGTGTGAIVDGTGTATCGTARVVQFAVTGFSGLVGSGSVNITLTHTYAGDLRATLVAPNATQFLLFGRIGSTAGMPFGDNSDFGGTYMFTDVTSNNIWTAASLVNATTAIPAAFYRTQATGPAANTTPGPAFTSLTTFMHAVPAANVNGTWSLRMEDCAGSDTGSVTAAQLNLFSPSAAPATLQGRVITADGTGIKNVVVTVQGGNLKEPVTILSTTFGYFKFDGLEAGQTYIVSVQARRFVFADPVVAVDLMDDLKDLTFQATP